MWTGMEFLLILQDLRDSLPYFITEAFNFLARHEFQYFIPILLGAFFLWCLGKKEGELLLLSFSFSNLVGYLTKNIVKQPRPWILDPEIQPDAASKRTAPGYSLPSGHTTSAVAGFGIAAWVCTNKALVVLFLFLAVILPFSRMFLGVHTPIDIIVAIIIVIAVCFVNYRVLEWSHESDRNRLYALIGYLVAAIAISIACDLFAGKILSNKMTGMSMAIPICLLIEERFIRYEVPSISMKDRSILSIPGLVIAFVLMEALYMLVPSFGATLSTTFATAFVIIVYPYILKKRFTQ